MATKRKSEKALAKIFSNGKVNREDVFITSKVWNTHHSYEKAGECLEMSLRDLQLSYLDMYLIHWPLPFFECSDDLLPMDKEGNFIASDVDFMETWRALEDAVTAGKVKSIGLSNFNKEQIERVINEGRIKPSNLQIEVHPYFTQVDLIRFCQKNDIIVTAYSPLANNSNSENRKHDSPNLIHEPDLVEIGQKHNKTAVQVAIRWGLQRNTIVIPKSVTKKRIHENIDVFNFTLNEQEMATIDKLNRNWRTCDLSDKSFPYYPFQ